MIRKWYLNLFFLADKPKKTSSGLPVTAKNQAVLHSTQLRKARRARPIKTKTTQPVVVAMVAVVTLAKMTILARRILTVTYQVKKRPRLGLMIPHRQTHRILTLQLKTARRKGQKRGTRQTPMKAMKNFKAVHKPLKTKKPCLRGQKKRWTSGKMDHSMTNQTSTSPRNNYAAPLTTARVTEKRSKTSGDRMSLIAVSTTTIYKMKVNIYHEKKSSNMVSR